MNTSPSPEPGRDGDAATILARAARELFAMGRADLAEAAARLAVASDPFSGEAHNAMAGVLDATGRFEEALHHWRQATALIADSPRQKVNLALALLGAEDWDSGLPLYEARLDTGDWSTIAARPSLDALRLHRAAPDTALTGKRVLVVTEQGLGDAIWAARFLAPLAARCGELTLATNAALRPLLERVEGPARILAPPADQPDARINLNAPAAATDFVMPIMSLPWLLGARPAEATTSQMPYLTPDPVSVTAWRARFRRELPNARRIIGLIWRANPVGPAAVSRSIPADALAPFADVAGAGFVILQGGPPEVRMEVAPVLPSVIDGLAGSAAPPQLDEFAAAIAATDILISVDTMGAHLAGAMAHPGIVLLPTAPSFCGLFWGNSGNRSGWYPSLRLVRQTRYWDWSGAVEMVREMLMTGSGA